MKVCTCVGTCKGPEGLGTGWTCALASDPSGKFLPADQIGELDPYEGCCHWCGKRGCDGDCRCLGCGEPKCRGNCGPPSYLDIVFGSGL